MTRPGGSRIRAVAACLACLVSLGAAGPAQDDVARLRMVVAEHPEDARAHFDLATALPLPAGKDEALREFERAIEGDRANPRYGNQYRRACVLAWEYQRCIDFLEKESDAHPEVAALHLNLALAYVDMMPTPGLGIVGQGLLSNRSIHQLDLVLESDPGSWAAMFGRAMNHLHWPRMLLHAPSAIADFKSCLGLQASVPRSGMRPHHLLPYLGLGDAYVKNSQIAEARQTWQGALKLFPSDPRLVRRLALDDDGLRKFVEEERGLAKPIDTDLSFLWTP